MASSARVRISRCLAAHNAAVTVSARGGSAGPAGEDAVDDALELGLEVPFLNLGELQLRLDLFHRQLLDFAQRSLLRLRRSA